MILDPSRLESLRQTGADALPLADRTIAPFVASGQASLDSLDVRQAIETDDAPGLARAAHKLRESAASLRAVKVSPQCLELQERGREGGSQGSDELFASLGEATDSTIVLLRGVAAPVLGAYVPTTRRAGARPSSTLAAPEP